MSAFHFAKPLDQVTLKDCQNLLERLKIQCLSAQERTSIWNEWTSFLEFDCTQDVLIKLERAISAELHSPEIPATPELERINQQQLNVHQEIQEHINSQPQQQALLSEVKNLEEQIQSIELRIQELQQENQKLDGFDTESQPIEHVDAISDETTTSFADCLKQYRSLMQDTAAKEEWQALLNALQTLQAQETLLDHQQADWAQKAEDILGIAGEDLFALKDQSFELKQISKRCQHELPGFEPYARYYLLNSSLQPLQVALQQWQAQASKTESEVHTIREQIEKVEGENQRLKLYLELVTSIHELKRKVS